MDECLRKNVSSTFNNEQLYTKKYMLIFAKTFTKQFFTYEQKSI